MADAFYSDLFKLTTTGATTLYTTPAATTTLIKSVYSANIDTVSVTIDLYITRGATNYYIIKNGIIPPQTTLQIITEPIVLEASDVLVAQASTAFAIDITVSYMERT